MSRPRIFEVALRLGGVLALWLPLLAGCTAPQAAVRTAREHPESLRAPLDADGTALEAATMEECIGDFLRLRENPTGRSRNYLLPREHDTIEQSLAQYLASRERLQLVAIQGTPPGSQGLLSRRAKSHLARCDASLARAALDDAVLRRALNQGFHRSGIPRGTCDRIIEEVTDSQFASSLAGQEHPSSVQRTSLDESLPTAAGAEDTRGQIGAIIRRRSILFPSVENELWHSEPARLLASTGRVAREQYRRGQSAFMTAFSKLKNPASAPLAFTADQRRQIRESLQPGDILLTYTEGSASNLFIPGNFKHAITFVGTADERGLAGLSDDLLLAIAGTASERLPDVLGQTKTAAGEAADVVESVAEGVLLNNLDRILTERVNRLAVLRPHLTPEERAWQLVDVLSLVGDEYDFSFDLTDGSDQVCTEVVYRSLQGRGGIDFPLTRHAGSLTLTADEMLKYHLRRGSQFECILIVDEDPAALGQATILMGGEGEAWLERLLMSGERGS